MTRPYQVTTPARHDNTPSVAGWLQVYRENRKSFSTKNYTVHNRELSVNKKTRKKSNCNIKY